jgi:hypothetical protein
MPSCHFTVVLLGFLPLAPKVDHLYLYSNHPKTGPSGFDEFDLSLVAEWSGFRMPFENQTKLSSFRTVLFSDLCSLNRTHLSGF